MPIIPFKDKNPVVASTAWVAPDAWVIGAADVADDVAIFFGSVLRGDILPISVGRGSNIQEGALLHTSTGLGPCVVGADVTIGHHAIIHGCTVKDNCIIGMGATLLDGAVVEENSMVGANSLVTMKTVIPAGVLAVGTPAKVVRKLSDAEIAQLRDSARHYRELKNEYKKYFAADR